MTTIPISQCEALLQVGLALNATLPVIWRSYSATNVAFARHFLDAMVADSAIKPEEARISRREANELLADRLSTWSLAKAVTIAQMVCTFGLIVSFIGLVISAINPQRPVLPGALYFYAIFFVAIGPTAYFFLTKILADVADAISARWTDSPTARAAVSKEMLPRLRAIQAKRGF